MPDVRVSVIIPCRTAERHLPTLLESLACQDHADHAEFVFVDNGSTDRSRAVADRFRGRMRLRIVEAPLRANGGYARNVGVSAALADKLLFVDADDAVGPGYLQAMAGALDEHPFVTSRVDTETLNPPWLRNAHGPTWQSDHVPVVFGFLPGTGINVGVRRALFERVGGFPEHFTGSQDLLFSWRIQLAGVPVHFVPEALYRYRHRETLRGLFRQTKNWGQSNVLLYREMRGEGMPPRRLRQAVRDWRDAFFDLAAARTRPQFAGAAVGMGYCVGRLIGSLRYRRLYL